MVESREDVMTEGAMHVITRGSSSWSMTIKALLYAYILGGLTFIPLVLAAFVCYTIYTSVPVEELSRKKQPILDTSDEPAFLSSDVNDLPKPRKGWLTVRRTFEESAFDGSYVTLVRSFLDARSKDPKRSRPKDMWYVVLKGKVLYLYEDEGMTDCEAAIELSSHDVTIYPDNLLDGELFTKRNAICLRTKRTEDKSPMPSITKAMKFESLDVDTKVEQTNAGHKQKEREREVLLEQEKRKDVARTEALDRSTPWFMFVRSTVEMEDWYLALLHASEWPPHTPVLSPLQKVFLPSDMDHLVSTLDEQPDVIPMRWLNALLGRIFYSFYRTQLLESFIIGRLMKKLSKVKRPAFLADVIVTEVSVGNTTPTFSKPMLKELTKEGDASMEVHVQYKGEIRVTVEATATINLGSRFKSYTVKLVLAAVLKELDGNLLVKVKRPPSNRIWYAFTQTPKMVLEVEPIVSDRQITWGMILTTIESRLKEIVRLHFCFCIIHNHLKIQESVVMPNMDDIAFFETTHYNHRGGVWSDAAKHDRYSTRSRNVHHEAASGVPEKQSSDTPDENETSTQEQPEPMRPAEISDENPSLARPRTWSAVERDNGLESLIAAPGPAQEQEEQRGRSTETEKISPQRSHSQPGVSIAQSQHGKEESENGDLQRMIIQSRRSSSQHSSSQGSESEPPTTLTEPSTPSKNSETARSPSSFLSTLKSRASDKQALSNTAKEAMKKWGVNWGGLKKDSNSGEEIPDHGSVGSRSATRSESVNLTMQKSRATYAQVRAAVAERHRDKVEEGPSVPNLKGKERSVSGSSTSSLVDQTSPDGSNAWTSTEDEDAERLNSPIHVQPQGKTMIIPGIHASHRGQLMSMGNVAPPPPQSPPQPDGTAKIYRLWKPTVQQDSTEPGVGEEGSLSSPPLGTPPPLPPRRTPTSAIFPPEWRAASEGNNESNTEL